MLSLESILGTLVTRRETFAGVGVISRMRVMNLHRDR